GPEPEPTFRPVHQDSVRQPQVDADVYAEDLAGGLGLASARLLGPTGRRLAGGQVDDPDPIPLADEPGEGGPAGDLQVVRVWGDGDDVQAFRQVGHVGSALQGNSSVRG